MFFICEREASPLRDSTTQSLKAWVSLISEPIAWLVNWSTALSVNCPCRLFLLGLFHEKVSVNLAPRMRNFFFSTFTRLDWFNDHQTPRDNASMTTDTPTSTGLSSLRARVQVCAAELSADQFSGVPGGFLPAFSLHYLHFHEVSKCGASCFLLNSSLALGLMFCW